MKAEASYRFLRSQNGGEPEIGIEAMDEVEAFGLLAVERTIHILGGWDTWPCDCGYGFHAVREFEDEDGNVRSTCRQIHVVPDETEIEALALAVGLLGPASIDATRFEAVLS